MPNYDGEFISCFYKQTKDNKWEVFVLSADEGMYHSIGVFEFQETAKRIMEARSYGSAVADKWSAEQ